MALLKQNIAIDFGSVNTLIAVEGQGVTFNEPTVVAIRKDSHKIIAIGEAANEMLGKTPGSVVAIRPLLRGTVNDFELAAIFLKMAIKKAVGQTSPFRAITGGIVAVSGDISELEQRTMQDVLVNAGIRVQHFLEKPIAALNGMGIDVSRPQGHLVIILGGETCEIAVVSLGGIVFSRCFRFCGVDMDRAVVNYIRQEYNLVVPITSAEILKISLCDLLKRENNSMEIRGRALSSSLPGSVTITSDEITECVMPTVKEIIAGIKEVLENTPPELVCDILMSGIHMCGGISQLLGLRELINEATGIPVTLDPDPMACTCNGAINHYIGKTKNKNTA